MGNELKAILFAPKCLICLLVLAGFILVSSCSQKIEKPKIKNGRFTIMPVSHIVGNGAKNISPEKVDAAMNLAIMNSGRYTYIPKKVTDSVAAEMKKEKSRVTSRMLAKHFDADYMMISNTSVLKNMLRTDIILHAVQGKSDEVTGKGYDLINYRLTGSDKLVYDPSLLSAAQRAFADAVDDTLLYDSLSGSLQVYPAPTLVVGSFFFKETEGLYDWRLYDNKVVNSFDAVVNTIDTIRESKNFVVYDEETRDAIYAMFGLYAVENYTLPSREEVRALSELEVEYFIGGGIERVKEGAAIMLNLYKISKGELLFVRGVDELLEEDSLVKFIEKVRQAAGRLILAEQQATGKVEQVKE